MHREKKILFVIILLILSTVFLSSCSNNPNAPEEIKFAPARYNWDIDTLEIQTKDVFISDTNSYFYISNEYQTGEMIYYVNGEKRCFNTEIYSQSLDGTDETNLYIAGGKYVNYPLSVPVLRKFSGGNITDVFTGNIKDTNYLFKNVKYIDDKVWCVTTKGEIYCFSGSSYDYYKIDSVHYDMAFICKDRNLNLNVILYRDYYDSLICKVYKYSSSEWSLIFNENVTQKGYYLFSLYEGVKDRIFCHLMNDKYNGQYEFFDGLFERLPYEEKTGVYYNFAGGNSLSNVILYGHIVNKPFIFSELFHYDGYSASNEGFQDYLSWYMYAKKINYKFERYYLLFLKSFTFRSYLIKGIKKLKN